MSSAGQSVIDEFNRLPQTEQIAVHEVIARRMVPADGTLSDNDLTLIAAETFALLDE